MSASRNERTNESDYDLDGGRLTHKEAVHLFLHDPLTDALEVTLDLKGHYNGDAVEAVNRLPHHVLSLAKHFRTAVLISSHDRKEYQRSIDQLIEDLRRTREALHVHEELLAKATKRINGHLAKIEKFKADAKIAEEREATFQETLEKLHRSYQKAPK